MPIQMNKFIGRLFRRNPSDLDEEATATSAKTKDLDRKNQINLKKQDYMDQRDEWSSKLDFILSCVGYAIGI
jgi:hypothetical protein